MWHLYLHKVKWRHIFLAFPEQVFYFMRGETFFELDKKVLFFYLFQNYIKVVKLVFL